MSSMIQTQSQNKHTAVILALSILAGVLANSFVSEAFAQISVPLQVVSEQLKPPERGSPSSPVLMENCDSPSGCKSNQ